MGVPKLISSLMEEGNISLTARNNPTNLGGLAGQIIDEKIEDNNKIHSNTLSITNDFVSLGATGGSGANFQTLISNGPTTVERVNALISQFAIFYDLLNNGGVIDKIESGTLYDPYKP